MSEHVDRLTSIRDAIAPHVTAFYVSNADKVEAQEAANTANTAHTNSREGIALALAFLATSNGWTQADAASGLKMAIDMPSNREKPKSIATFASEMNGAMHPLVREWMPTFVTVAAEAFAQEKEDAKQKLPTPVTKAFGRRWQTIMGMVTAAKERNYIGTVAELRNFAEARDPDLNAEKQAKVINDIRAQLSLIFANFADDDIKAAADCLAGITAESLTSCRGAMKTDAAVAGPLTPPAPVAAPVVPASEVAEGAVDLDGAFAAFGLAA